MATKLGDGGCSADSTGICGCATPVGVAIRKRYGQSEELARRLGTSTNPAAMVDIPEVQWCFPFRRQQAGVAVPVTAKVIGATKLQAKTDSTRLAMIRRILFRERNTSQVDVTNERKNRY